MRQTNRYDSGESVSQTQPPYPPQQQYAQPPKKSHTLRNVLLIGALLLVLVVGGCLALIGTAANEVSKSIDKSDNAVGGPKNPLEIKAGEPFEVQGFKYAAGWTITREFGGYVKIKNLKVTNERSDQDSALVEIKFWKGSEVLALTDCTTEPIAPKTTTSLSCSSADKLPKAYDRITINDTF